MDKKRSDMRKSRSQCEPSFPAISYVYAVDFVNALSATNDLPPHDRWTMTLALLPDALLETMVFSRTTVDDPFDLYGPMVHVTIRTLLKDAPDPGTPNIVFFVLRVSIAAELERRRKLFSSDVIHLSNPFRFTEEPIQFLGPDGVVLNEEETDKILDYYLRAGMALSPVGRQMADRIVEPVAAPVRA